MEAIAPLKRLQRPNHIYKSSMRISIRTAPCWLQYGVGSSVACADLQTEGSRGLGKRHSVRALWDLRPPAMVKRVRYGRGSQAYSIGLIELSISFCVFDAIHNSR